MRLLSCALLIAISGGCARVEAPPGGDRDTEAPRVVETDPAQNALASAHVGSNRPVRIVFHETLSERSPPELAMVSPETGEVDVDRDGKELQVTIDGGWKPNQVYRVTVMPGIVDRFGNARTTAYELVFSTGAPVLANALGGLATDRITGRPVAGARVEAIARADSIVYTSVSDSSGFFAVRALPVGAYHLRVYADQNRNRQLDNVEARATSDVNLGASDTVAVQLSLLGTDTTPARLLRAEIRDSMQVRLTLDDYAEQNTVHAVRISVWQLPDSSAIAGGRLLTPDSFQALRPDTARAALPVPVVPTATDTTRSLPINQLVWVPAAPLRVNTRYRFQVSGYTNMHGIPNGGGSVTATVPAPRPAQPAARDTVRR
jgi:hypothetical protein